eukprot:scaffold13096_cov193-Alexandrium_tamarense.AAC.3
MFQKGSVVGKERYEGVDRGLDRWKMSRWACWTCLVSLLICKCQYHRTHSTKTRDVISELCNASVVVQPLISSAIRRSLFVFMLAIKSGVK